MACTRPSRLSRNIQRKHPCTDPVHAESGTPTTPEPECVGCWVHQASGVRMMLQLHLQRATGAPRRQLGTQAATALQLLQLYRATSVSGGRLHGEAPSALPSETQPVPAIAQIAKDTHA